MLVVVVRVLPASSCALVMICTRTFLRRRRMAAFSLVRRVVMVLVWPPSIANVWFFTKTTRRGVRSAPKIARSRPGTFMVVRMVVVPVQPFVS